MKTERKLIEQLLNALDFARRELEAYAQDESEDYNSLQINEAIDATNKYLAAPATDTLAEQYAKLAQHCAMLEAKLAAPEQSEPLIKFKHGCKWCGKLGECEHAPQPTTPEKSEPVGEAQPMPGAPLGFTIAVFKIDDVPVGTKLYAAPVPQGRQHCWRS